jgi:hypothetical protein
MPEFTWPEVTSPRHFCRPQHRRQFRNYATRIHTHEYAAALCDNNFYRPTPPDYLQAFQSIEYVKRFDDTMTLMS